VRYWDSSALASLCLGQSASNALAVLLSSDDGVVLWWGTRVETESAVARLRRLGELDDGSETEARGLFAQVFALAAEVGPVEEVRSLACRLVQVHLLRAADALQLAAALVWADRDPSGMGFVCLDRGLREAARREGFDVAPR
jgi:predicted nucleic acid-binding protein